MEEQNILRDNYGRLRCRLLEAGGELQVDTVLVYNAYEQVTAVIAFGADGQQHGVGMVEPGQTEHIATVYLMDGKLALMDMSGNITWPLGPPAVFESEGNHGT